MNRVKLINYLLSYFLFINLLNFTYCKSLYDTRPLYNSKILIGASNGSLWYSDDGISFNESIPPWSYSGSKNNPVKSYGNIYDINYDNNILTIVGDLNHVFVSFDKGKTWKANAYFNGGNYPFPNNQRLENSLETLLLNKTFSDPQNNITQNNSQTINPPSPGSNIDIDSSTIVDFRGLASDGKGGYMIVGSRSQIFTNISGNPLTNWQNYNCQNLDKIVPYFNTLDQSKFNNNTEVIKKFPNGRCNLFYTGVKYGGGSFFIIGTSQINAIQSAALYTKDFGNTWNIPSIPYDKNSYSISDLKFINNRWIASLSVIGSPFGPNPLIDYGIILQSENEDPGSNWYRYEGLDKTILTSNIFFEISEDEIMVTGHTYGYFNKSEKKGGDLTPFKPSICRKNADGTCNLGQLNTEVNGFINKIYYAPKRKIWYILTAQGWLYYSTDLNIFKQVRLGLHSLNAILEF